MALPDSLIDHVVTTFPEQQDVWFDELGRRLPALIEKWKLKVGLVLPGGWNSSVLACRRNQRPVVLKITLSPEDAGLEAAALRHWGQHAAAEVLECEPTLGALLLTRLEPGTPLTSNLSEAAAALGRLHAAREPVNAFPSLAERYADASMRLRAMWSGAHAVVAERQMEAAAAELIELSSRPGPHQPVLLHGDAVPTNFLLGASGYRAIDPRAVIGDPAFDIAYWALFADNGANIEANAQTLCAALGLNHQRVRRWTRAIAVDRSLQIATSTAHTELLSRLQQHSRQLDAY